MFAGRGGAQRQAGPGSGRDRRWSARRRSGGTSRFSCGTQELVETQPVVVQMLEGVQAVAERSGTARSPPGSSAISTAGLPSISTTRPTSPARNGVGDEQLFAVDFVMIALELGGGAQGGQVGAGRRFGQSEAGDASGRWPAGAAAGLSVPAMPKVRSGSTAPMQPWTEARAGHGGVERAEPGQEAGEAGERGPLAAVTSDR